jgi:hypothetical protein
LISYGAIEPSVPSHFCAVKKMCVWVSEKLIGHVSEIQVKSIYSVRGEAAERKVRQEAGNECTVLTFKGTLLIPAAAGAGVGHCFSAPQWRLAQ